MSIVPTSGSCAAHTSNHGLPDKDGIIQQAGRLIDMIVSMRLSDHLMSQSYSNHVFVRQDYLEN